VSPSVEAIGNFRVFLGFGSVIQSVIINQSSVSHGDGVEKRNGSHHGQLLQSQLGRAGPQLGTGRPALGEFLMRFRFISRCVAPCIFLCLPFLAQTNPLVGTWERTSLLKDGAAQPSQAPQVILFGANGDFLQSELPVDSNLSGFAQAFDRRLDGYWH
jgi:hypothetical protein